MTILKKFLLSFLFSITKFSNLDKVIGCSLFVDVTKHAEASKKDNGKYVNLDERILEFFVRHHKTKNEYSFNEEKLLWFLASTFPSFSSFLKLSSLYIKK